MADASDPSSAPVDSAAAIPAASSSASEQARIRKERREAKLRQNPGARLNKISGLGGGLQRDPPPPPQAPSIAQHADPDEVDISQHYYEPAAAGKRPGSARANRDAAPRMPESAMDENALRQMMLGMDPSMAGNPFAGLPGMGGMDGMGGGAAEGNINEDPMMQMLQQLMGGAGAGGLPNGLPSFPSMSGPATKQAGDTSAYVWRIVHALFALALGLYVALGTTFTGTRTEREYSRLASGATSVLNGDATGGVTSNVASVRFFWLFATTELVLQTSRFFLERGKVQPVGMLGTVMGFLPSPWRDYLALVLRYSRIWTTVSGDAMVVVFVLGICAWARGGGA